MVKRESDIKLNCQQALSDAIISRSDWKYLKSKRSFKKPISKHAFVGIYTGLSSKVDFVDFEFSLHMGHKLVGDAIELIHKMKSPQNWAIIHALDHWVPKAQSYKRCTVYEYHWRRFTLFEESRAQGDTHYLRLEEFPERLEQIFTLAEAEIDRVFDISSEEALIRSIVEKPIGFFRPNEVLIIQLMLGNPEYYDELVSFYSQPIETIRSLTRNSLEPQLGAKTMEAYQQGNFPKFDFV